MSSMAAFTPPATTIASPTSTRVTRSSRRRCGPRSGVPVPVAGQAGMQVHRMRHHRRAQDGGGQQHALRPAKSRHQPADDGIGRRCCDEETGREADRDQQQQSGDHAFEQLLAALVLD